MANFNNLQKPSLRIQHRFPSTVATSYRDFALTVNHSRAVTQSIFNYIKRTEGRITAMKKNLKLLPASNYLNNFSFRVCGCCLDPSNLYTPALVYGMNAWALCVLVWLLLSSALLTLKTAFVPVYCNTNVTNFSNQRCGTC